MKINSEKVTVAGPVGILEGILDIPDLPRSTIDSPAYISVNCHPHSLHGGSMTNKVIHTVSRCIAGLGIPSLRFNFRGVGKSEGSFDHGQGERQDLAAAIDWLEKRYPNAKLILSGFSFGAYVTALAANDLSPTLLLSVAPPVKRFDFDGFMRPRADWTVIMGDEDELVEFSAVQEWVTTFEPVPQLVTMNGASHFFHGRLLELREHVESCVDAHINN